MLVSTNNLAAVAILIVVVLDFSSTAPTDRGAPGYRGATRKLKSTKRGRDLMDKMRLGMDKKGILAGWKVDSLQQLSSLSEALDPVEYISPKPQLSGNMGNAEAPRRLNKRKQFQPKLYVAPNPKLRDAPGGLETLSNDDMLAIATNFWVQYNYTSNDLTTIRKMVSTTQRNYGLNITGELDSATVTAMLQPRCGFPDAPAEYNTFPNREHWTNTDVTYKITGYTPDMSQCQTRNAFKRAFRIWEKVTDLTFKEVDADDADIIIYFGYQEHGDGYPFDGANGLLAHAFTPGTEALNGDSHFDEGEFWTLGKGRVFDTFNGNSGGKSCVFPFYYKDKQYSACTTIGRNDDLEWCATTSDYDEDEQWAFCPHESLFTYGGNADNDPCVLPFIFLGKTFDSCTYEGRSDGYRWCATTPNYDDESKWGFCPDRAHGSEGGNSNGASCVFPFTFEGYEYNECTTQGRNDYKLWCATTSDYDGDGLYGFCSQDGYSLFLVATHEFGHAIGLDHSNVPGALMYPVYSYHEDFVLPDDDKEGARALYGGARTKNLPPLQLEQCGGDLTVTETQSTASPKTNRPPKTTATPGRCDTFSKPTDMCQRTIDAAMLYQNELFVFQGPNYWRVKGKGSTQTRVLETVKSYWPELKCGVNAAYQRPSDSKLVFFKNSQYYIYDGSIIERGYPRDVTELGLPPRTEVSGVVHMRTKNPSTKRNEERLYYFVGDKVYRANVKDGKIMNGTESTTLGETDAWAELPSSVDAVYRESQTKPYTIFVKGKKYYRYENMRGSLDFKRNVRKLFRCRPNSDNFVALPLRERRP